MKNLFVFCLPFFVFAQAVRAQENAAVTPVMVSLHEDLKKLTPYIFSPQKFSEAKHAEEILSYLIGLSGKADLADHRKLFNSDYSAQTKLSLLSQSLKDASRSFERGNMDYTRFLVKNAVQLCISCHTSGANSKNYLFPSDKKVMKELPSDFDRAEYALITRQFDLVPQLLDKTARASAKKDPFLAENALKYMVLFYASIKPDYALAQKKLTELQKNKNFSESLRQQIADWIVGFKNLKVDNSPSITKIKERLHVKSGHLLTYDPKLFVEKIHSAAELNLLLSRPETPQTQRVEALFLLGLIANAMDQKLFLSLDDAYFKLCIDQEPASEHARTCHNALKMSLELKSTGSSGVNLDPEDEKMLQDYAKKAGVSQKR